MLKAAPTGERRAAGAALSAMKKITQTLRFRPAAASYSPNNGAAKAAVRYLTTGRPLGRRSVCRRHKHRDGTPQAPADRSAAPADACGSESSSRQYALREPPTPI